MLNVQCVWLPSPPVLTQKVSTVLSPQRKGYHSIANGTLCRWELTVTESVVFFYQLVYLQFFNTAPISANTGSQA